MNTEVRYCAKEGEKKEARREERSDGSWVVRCTSCLVVIEVGTVVPASGPVHSHQTPSPQTGMDYY